MNLTTHTVELRPALDEQALPEHWVVELLNEAGTVIARWPDDAPVLGNRGRGKLRTGAPVLPLRAGPADVDDRRLPRRRANPASSTLPA